MTSNEITDAIMEVARGNCSVNEGAKSLCMSVIDFERMMNAWEKSQQYWDKMREIAIISEIKNGKTDEEIMESLGCSESEIERDKRLLGRTLQAFKEVREGRKAPGCGSCVAGVYISEFMKMMAVEEQDGKN